MEENETYIHLITCQLCEKEIGYAEQEDDGCSMCLDCYYNK